MAVALAFAAAATVTVAQPVEVQAKVPSCVVTDQNAVVAADVAGDPQAVRVYFRSDVGKEFYYVVATKTPEGWVAKLPKPAVPPTSSIVVYIEAISKSKEPSRTADSTIGVQTGCKAPAVASAPLGGIAVVGGTPVGFSTVGITSIVAGGGGILGMSTATAAVVGAGVVGAGTVGVVAATDDDDESPH